MNNYITNNPINFNDKKRQALSLDIGLRFNELVSAADRLAQHDRRIERDRLAAQDITDISNNVARISSHIRFKSKRLPHIERHTVAAHRLARRCNIPFHLAETLAPIAGMSMKGGANE